MIKTTDLTPHRKKIAITVIVIALLYVLFGFFGAPFLVRSILENQVAEAIGRQISMESVRVNPLTLSVTLRNFSIIERAGGPFVDSDEVYVNLQTSSLIKWALVLKSVQLVNPDIHLVRSGETTFNFSDIGSGKDPEQSQAKESTDAGGFAMAIYAAGITSGKIAMEDQVAGVTHRIEDFSLSISDFSSRPTDVNVYTLFNLAARVNGAALSVEGKSLPFATGRQTKAEIGIQALQASHYLPYVTLPDNLQVQALTLEIDTEIEFHMLETSRPELVVAGVLTAMDARLADGNGDPFVNHPKWKLDILPSRVLTGELRLAELESSAPEFFLKRLSTGKLYLPFLVVKAHKEAEEKAAEDTSGEFQPLVTIDRLNLKQGVVHFNDQSNSEPFTTTIRDLSLEVDNFGYNSDRTATIRLSLKTDADESVALSGTAKLEPPASSGEIHVSDIDVSRYLPYYRELFEFKTVDGKLSFGGNFRYRQEGETPLVSLAGVYLNMQTLKVVDDDDEPLINLEKLHVGDTIVELDSREATLGDVVIQGPQLVCRREKDGTMNLVKAFVPEAETPNEPVASVSGADNTPGDQLQAAPFVVNLNRIKIADGTVDVEDRVPTTPARFRLDEINLNATNLSTAPGHKGQADLSIRWEQGGLVKADGSVTIAPPDADLKVKVEQMDIRPLQPYLSEQADLIVTQGSFNTQGRMEFSQEGAAAPKITYAGKVGLNRFASIDRKNADDFLKWEALLLDNLEVGVNPPRFSIDQVSMADFFARVIVDADGSINLVSMFSGDENPVVDVDQTDRQEQPKPVDEPPDDRPQPSIRIARITLSGGDVDFSDRFIKPTFNAKFQDLGGHVLGLESIAEKRADVLLEGMWSNHAPVKITGEINPLIQYPYVDLNLKISDIELSPFSPYSGKYLGYVLEKGKLTFNVAYLMENSRLEGKNSVFINQLALGDSVESSEAVNLPIKMAAALLKDRDGNIELNLPVSGNLDDPEFKIGGVILTVLNNLIVTIVTSPFTVLGSIAGGGEELSYLDFDAGISEISPENAEKMDKLAKILYERPGLKLDIQGTLNPDADREALRVQLLENRLRAEKLRHMITSGKSAVPLKEIILQDEERQTILEAVFEATAIAVPVDDSGKPIELTPETMETLLRTHTKVTSDDYRKLASARAFAAKNYLLQSEQVERERIFIVEPQAGDKQEKQKEPGAGQIVFSLK